MKLRSKGRGAQGQEAKVKLRLTQAHANSCLPFALGLALAYQGK